MKPFVESNDLSNDGEALRRRADRDGYLFLRNLVDKEAVLAARRDIAGVLQDAGWIDGGMEPEEAMTSHPPHVSGEPEFSPVYDRVQRIESFHTLAHDEKIMAVTGHLLGDDVLLQPSNIARFIFPSNLEQTTPAHQDFVHIQGTPDVWTAWLPLGDCPRLMGGLGVLTGSHEFGVLPVSRSLGAGGLRAHFEKIGGEWVSSPFDNGDILFFHSHTVHWGLPNLSGNRLRLSVDFRYQRASDPVMDKVLMPHQGRLSWEDVYRGWKSDRYQYHWKRFDLTPVEKVPVEPVDEAV
ncbi:MAG: phytanoyl-CoA dioxygenase family protein [Caldilineaceae bacterium]|nr:phytanoyl-CoA dioxygenase family protein [Caldilineaceae bacterium]